MLGPKLSKKHNLSYLAKQLVMRLYVKGIILSEKAVYEHVYFCEPHQEMTQLSEINACQPSSKYTCYLYENIK